MDESPVPLHHGRHRAYTRQWNDDGCHQTVMVASAGGDTVDDMGIFRIDIEIENPANPGQRRLLKSVLVDTGAELSWVPASVLESLRIDRVKVWHFRQADGTVLARWTGEARVHAAETRTVDEVV